MVDSDLVDDLAQRLAAQCKGQQLLKDAGIDPALRIAEQHSATSARFVQALTQLLRYKMDTARAEEEMGRAVCAAVETRRATFTAGYGALSLGHPLLANAVESGTDSEGLLRALAGEADAALTRARKAVGAMPPHNELLTLQEDAWREHALARDQARQEHVHFAELHLAGLRAKKDCLLRAFRSLKEDAIELPEPVGSIAQINVEDAVGAATQVRRILYTRSEGPTHIPRASLDPPPPRVQHHLDLDNLPRTSPPLLNACVDLAKCVHENEQACGGEGRAQVAAIAARVAEEQRGRRPMLQAALQACAAELIAARHAIEAPAALHDRRVRAEAMLVALEALQAEVVAARKEERKAKRVHEDLEDEAAPGDQRVERAQAKLQKVSGQAAALSRRRDGAVAEVTALSATPVPAQGQVIGDDAAVPLDFHELPVRAQRTVQPFQAYEMLDAAGRARFDIELLLRRAGLLACERSYASYSDLAVIASSKPNVKRATLRGVARGTTPKILKEYAVSEFKSVKRAVAAASRLRHPGIVPVECAFLERGDVVVVQSPCYAGGNMREWCQGKAVDTRLRAAQRVAEAVRFLHSHGVLHRDLKPENVVFDGDGPAATPALCDFDLSVNTQETMASTMMRGTLLYLAPDPMPSAASDIFALGVTLLDVLFCDGDEERLRQMVLGSGRAVADLADLERVRGGLARRTNDAELAMLIHSMLAPQPTERPEASAVAETLSELLDVRTCYVCKEPWPRDQGLECDGTTTHFACDECFSFHVSRAESLHKGGDKIKCCGFLDSCASTFTLQAAAQHATPLAFETLQRYADDRKHVALQGEFEQWKKGYEAELAAKSEGERRALAARRYIEEMMDLHCPKCRRVFGQFVGCAALTCEYAGCHAHFCAFCLVDCGADAHAHVRTCRLNPKQNEYFVSEAVWARIIDGERREKLQVYWRELEPEVKDVLSADASIGQIFRDLRLDGLLGVTSFAEQVAQLRGMGLTDERAMRVALESVGGDVTAALNILL